MWPFKKRDHHAAAQVIANMSKLANTIQDGYITFNSFNENEGAIHIELKSNVPEHGMVEIQGTLYVKVTP